MTVSQSPCSQPLCAGLLTAPENLNTSVWNVKISTKQTYFLNTLLVINVSSAEKNPISARAGANQMDFQNGGEGLFGVGAKALRFLKTIQCLLRSRQVRL
ncbi:hypothetical protein ACET3X_004640 [Alternaria dauci]|uniref:Uncharacterized protein n=1 Tax=Alternaria dauci TaxID=48095 RepID=A0ABR3UQZ7_9PLEO